MEYVFLEVKIPDKIKEWQSQALLRKAKVYYIYLYTNGRDKKQFQTFKD